MDSALTSARETISLSQAMSGLSPHTRRAYLLWIRRYFDLVQPTDGGLPFDQDHFPLQACEKLGAAWLRAYLGQLKDNGMGKQALTQAKSALIWLANWAGELGHISATVAVGLRHVRLPKAESGQRAGAWLPMSDLRQLLALDTHGADNSPLAARNVCLLSVLVLCGLRREEIAAARWQDVGVMGRYPVLTVHGKGEKLRTIKLPERVLCALEAWRAWHPNPEGGAPILVAFRSDGWPTENPLSGRAVWDVVQRAARRIGLKRLSPHDLRRSFARGAYEAGASLELIQQMLGHASVTTTERYVNATLKLDRAASDVLNEALQAEGERAVDAFNLNNTSPHDGAADTPMPTLP